MACRSWRSLDSNTRTPVTKTQHQWRKLKHQRSNITYVRRGWCVLFDTSRLDVHVHTHSRFYPIDFKGVMTFLNRPFLWSIVLITRRYFVLTGQTSIRVGPLHSSNLVLIRVVPSLLLLSGTTSVLLFLRFMLRRMQDTFQMNSTTHHSPLFLSNGENMFGTSVSIYHWNELHFKRFLNSTRSKYRNLTQSLTSVFLVEQILVIVHPNFSNTFEILSNRSLQFHPQI